MRMSPVCASSYSRYYLCVATVLAASEALTSGGAEGTPPKGMWPAAEPPTPCDPRARGVRLCTVLLGSPPCVRRLQVAERACVLSDEWW
jgi:hypothetical protein